MIYDPSVAGPTMKKKDTVLLSVLLQLQISALYHMQTYLHKICVKFVRFVELKMLCVAFRITSPYKYRYFAALSAL